MYPELSLSSASALLSEKGRAHCILIMLRVFSAVPLQIVRNVIPLIDTYQLICGERIALELLRLKSEIHHQRLVKRDGGIELVYIPSTPQTHL